VASQSASDVKILVKSILIEIPTEAAKRALGVGKENRLEATAWESYEAAIRLINEATGGLYSNPLFGDIVERSLGPVLQVQRVANAVSGALFPALWSVIDLPSGTEVQRIRADLKDLRRELRAAATEALVGKSQENGLLGEIDARAGRKPRRAPRKIPA